MTAEHDERSKGHNPLNVIDEAFETKMLNYFRHHPDFLIRHPEGLAYLDLPKRFDDSKILDLQTFANNHLRGEMDKLRQKANALVSTTRSNMSVQASTHLAVLALLEARDREEFHGVVQDEMPVLLDLDMACVLLEGESKDVQCHCDGRIGLLPKGYLDHRMGAQEAQLLQSLEPNDPLFGAMNQVVRSGALVRLHRHDELAPGVLVLGSRIEGTFAPGQGTELLTFLARVIEICMSKWLATSAK